MSPGTSSPSFWKFLASLVWYCLLFLSKIFKLRFSIQTFSGSTPNGFIQSAGAGDSNKTSSQVPLSPPEPTIWPEGIIALQSKLWFSASLLRSIYNPRRYPTTAIFIGIDGYADSPLRGCVHDAMALASSFEATQGTNAPVFPLIEGAATRATLHIALQAASRAVKPGGVIWLFHSGHGVTTTQGADEEADGRREGILLWDGVLGDLELKRLLEQELPKDALFVLALDSCHSLGMREAVAAPNRILLAAADEDSTAMTAAHLGHGGYLSAALMQVFKGIADANKDGKTTIGEIRDYTEQFFLQHCSHVGARDVSGRAVRQHFTLERSAPLGREVLNCNPNVIIS